MTDSKTNPLVAVGDFLRGLLPLLEMYPWSAIFLSFMIIVLLVATQVREAAYFTMLYYVVPLDLVLMFVLLLLEGRKVRGGTVRLARKLKKRDKTAIVSALRRATESTATTLGLAPNNVRANLFGADGQNMMRMIPGLWHNMEYPPEYSIKMPTGYGSTGRCFSNQSENVAILKKNWGLDRIQDKELRKVHKDLKWIISIPVLSPKEEEDPVWVMNVDGLLESKQKSELEKSIGKLYQYSYSITKVLGGEKR